MITSSVQQKLDTTQKQKMLHPLGCWLQTLLAFNNPINVLFFVATTKHVYFDSITKRVFFFSLKTICAKAWNVPNHTPSARWTAVLPNASVRKPVLYNIFPCVVRTDRLTQTCVHWNLVLARTTKWSLLWKMDHAVSWKIHEVYNH